MKQSKLGKKIGPFSEEHKRKIGESKKGKKRPDLAERNRRNKSAEMKAYYAKRKESQC